MELVINISTEYYHKPDFFRLFINSKKFTIIKYKYINKIINSEIPKNDLNSAKVHFSSKAIPKFHINRTVIRNPTKLRTKLNIFFIK